MPPPAPPPAVVSRKQDFIQAQTRLLEQPLEPSDAWRTVNQDAEGRLPDPVVRAVMLRLNHKLRQHELRVHARQASQHVAEQINTLYWNAAEAVAERDGGSEDVPEALSAYSDLSRTPSTQHESTVDRKNADPWSQRIIKLSPDCLRRGNRSGT